MPPRCGKVLCPVLDVTLSAEEMFKEAWCKKSEGGEAEAQVKWEAWKAKQVALKGKAGVEASSAAEEDEKQQNLELGDLGFASTRRYTPFPALVLSSNCAPGSKKVRFFGTGEVVVVPETNWTPYSVEAAALLLGNKAVNKAGFASALSQLSALAARVMGSSEDEEQVFTTQGKGRHLVPLTARSLAEDELFNNAAFVSKMHQVDNFWKCRNCPNLKLKLKMAAKRHARRCGERPKWPKKRSNVARIGCSACPRKFQTKKLLHSHYAASHPEKRRAYKCKVCQTTVLSWSNLRRHMAEKHGEVEWQCCSCDQTFNRGSNLVRHYRSKHDAKRTKSLTPLVQSIQVKVDDLLRRREAEPLSMLEESRLKNLLEQRNMLITMEEDQQEPAVGNDEGKEPEVGQLVKRRKKRSAATGPSGDRVRKSVRLQVLRIFPSMNISTIHHPFPLALQNMPQMT